MGLDKMGTRELALLPKVWEDFLKEAGLLRVVIIVVCGKFSLDCCCAFSLFS